MLNHPQAQLVTGCDTRLVAQLVALQQDAFPRQMQFREPEAYYREALADQRNINLVIKNERREVTGYLHALPLPVVVAELRPWDPGLEADPATLYVDIIQTLPGRRHYAGFLALIDETCREARDRGYRHIAMHVRISNGLSRLIQKLYPRVREPHRIEDWFGSGEPFDYLEVIPQRYRAKPGS